MSNVLICHTNRADGATLEDGAWSASFPVTNLATADISRAARTSSVLTTATRFRADLGAPYALRCVALAAHNLLTTAQWRVRAGTAPLDVHWATTLETSDSRLTVTGGANASRISGAGIVAATAPRYDYTLGGGQPRGVQVEAAATNLLLNSAALATQSVTVTAAAHTLTFYGTGTVTLSGASTAGPLVGTGANNRVSLSFTPSAGSLTLTVTGTVSNAQLQTGEATSYIPTTGAAATTTADTITLTGASFTACHSATAGTLYAEFDVASVSAGTRPIVALDDNTANERIELYASGTDLKFRVIDGGVTQADITIGTIAAETVYKVAVAWSANDFAACLSGGTVQTDASGTLPTVDRARFGADQAGNRLGGHLQRVLRWTSRLSNANLQAITTSGPDVAAVGGYDSGLVSVKQLSFYGDTPADWGMQYNALSVFDAVTARYLTVDLYAPGISYVQIGRLFVGGGWQPTRNVSLPGLGDALDELSSAARSLGGRKFGQARARLRRADMVFNWLTQAEANRVHEMQREVGVLGEVVYIPNPADMAHSQRYGGLGTLRELGAIEYPYVNSRAVPLRWEEKL